jgi:hypothetical protein
MRCRREALFGLHAKSSFRFRWCDQFSVVAEDHFWGIPRFQRYPRRVVKDREPIGDIRVAQSVRFPLETDRWERLPETSKRIDLRYEHTLIFLLTHMRRDSY